MFQKQVLTSVGILSSATVPYRRHILYSLYSLFFVYVHFFFFLADNSFNNQAEKSERRRPLYVCRVLHTAVWVAGSQKGDEQRCTVTIHGNVQSYDKYDLLENVDSAARVNWEHWDKYKNTPVGAVAMEKMFIARHPAKTDKNASSPRYTHYIGTLNKRILGSISYVKDVSNCSAICTERAGWDLQGVNSLPWI